MNSVYNVIIRPVVTERSFDLMGQNKYTFEVAREAPKEEIADAVEKLFNVRVLKVNTCGLSPRTSVFAMQWARLAHGRRLSLRLLLATQLRSSGTSRALRPK